MPFARKPRKSYDEAALYEYAVAALARKMRTVAELKRLLRQKVLPEQTAIVEEVVDRLKEHEYLNDSRYAAAYSSLRKDNQKFGSRRVVSDLKVKGVHSDVIASTVPAIYEHVDEVEQARKYLQRKRARQPADQKEAARIFRMLMRAGFSGGTTIKVLKTWKVDEETLAALESESSEVESPE